MEDINIVTSMHARKNLFPVMTKLSNCEATAVWDGARWCAKSCVLLEIIALVLLKGLGENMAKIATP